MLLQKSERPLPGGFCRRLVVAAALVAKKAVPCARIHKDLAIAAALLFDQLDVGHRDRSVLFAEMQLRRHLRLLVDILGDLAAVITDGGGKAGKPCGRKERDAAAEAGT